MAKLPSTAALRLLRKENVPFDVHTIAYKEKGGTEHSARVVGVDEHMVIKTLIFENETRSPVCVLMHGDLQVSTKKIAREINAKSLQPCSPKTAERHSGYRVGGTSPFGLKTHMPILMESSVADLPALIINGGSRGVLVQMAPEHLVRILAPVLGDIAQR